MSAYAFVRICTQRGYCLRWWDCYRYYPTLLHGVRGVMADTMYVFRLRVQLFTLSNIPLILRPPFAVCSTGVVSSRPVGDLVPKWLEWIFYYRFHSDWMDVDDSESPCVSPSCPLRSTRLIILMGSIVRHFGISVHFCWAGMYRKCIDIFSDESLNTP